MPLRRSERTASEARATRRPRSSSVMRACALATCRFSRAISVANSARAVSAASRSASRPAMASAASLARSSRPPSSAATAAGLEIGDAGDGRLELASFLLILRDRQRQGPFTALDGGGRVAHLLIEDQKGCPVFQLLAGGGHAAAEKCHYGLEHRWLPVMSVAHRWFVARNLNIVQELFEQRSRI